MAENMKYYKLDTTIIGSKWFVGLMQFESNFNHDSIFLKVFGK